MKDLFLTFLIASVLVFASCEPRDKALSREKLIPSGDLVPLLTDIYLADGLLAYPPVKIKYNQKDSLGNYVAIIEKHGYTKDQLDRTLKFYFIKKPKKLQNIYDQVLAGLTELQSRIQTEPEPPSRSSLWTGKSKYAVPEDGIHSTAGFKIAVSDTGLYTLSFNAVVFNDDQSINPRITVFFWRDNGTADGEKLLWEEKALVRDGTRHSYLLRGRLTDFSYTHLAGYLMNCDPQPDPWIKHAAVTEIILSVGKNTYE